MLVLSSIYNFTSCITIHIIIQCNMCRHNDYIYPTFKTDPGSGHAEYNSYNIAN